MNKPGALGLALVMAAAVSAACVQSVERSTPTPQPPAPTTAPTAAPVPTQAQPTAAPTRPPATLATVTPPSRPAPTATPTRPATSPSPTAKAVPVSTVQRFGLFLEIEGLAEENVVRGDTVVARGKTSPAAILSINGVIIPVDADGNFSVQLALDPGPNVIEVVASDLDGNEVSRVIAIVALPGGVQS